MLSKLSHRFVDFLEIPFGMVRMLADALAADSSNDSFSKVSGSLLDPRCGVILAFLINKIV